MGGPGRLLDGLTDCRRGYVATIRLTEKPPVPSEAQTELIKRKRPDARRSEARSLILGKDPLKGLSGKWPRWMTRDRWYEARTQGVPICGHIGATEDAASCRLASVRRPGSFSGQAPMRAGGRAGPCSGRTGSRP